MIRPPITPPPLAPGARVALVSPAGPLTDRADLARAEANARSLGWEPVVFPSALARHGYLAGDDASRAADVNAAIRDPRIDGIWCARGGYGTMRILDAIDYVALAPLAQGGDRLLRHHRAPLRHRRALRDS